MDIILRLIRLEPALADYIYVFDTSSGDLPAMRRLEEMADGIVAVSYTHLVEGNPVFIYLDAFCRDEHFAAYLPDYKNLDELKACLLYTSRCV